MLSLCAISFVFIYLIYSKNIVFGSDAEGFSYAYFETVQNMPRWILFAVLLLLAAFVFGGSRMIQKKEKLTLVGGLVLAIAIQILVQKIYPYPLEQNITSIDSNSFYTVALHYSPGDLLAHFLTLAPTFPEHAQTNMPGKILLFQFLGVFSSSPQVVGYLIVFISTSGGLLLYAICKRLFQDRTVGFYAFILYTLIPCKQAFLPILNTVTPVFILLSLYLFILYLDSSRKWFLLLLGGSLYALALFEPSPFIMGILFLGVLYRSYDQKKIAIKDLVWIILIPILTFLALHFLLVIFLKFDIIQALQYVFKDAADFNVRVGRRASFWMKEDLKEFFFAAGLPVMLLFVYTLLDLLTQWKMLLKSFLHWPMNQIYILCLCLTLGVVLLLGINLGEISRLWIYLAVFFQVPAAVYLAREARSNFLFFVLSGTLVLQTMITIQRVGFVLP